MRALEPLFLQKKIKTCTLFLAILWLSAFNKSYADTFILNSPPHFTIRMNYEHELLAEILSNTTAKYGEFDIQLTDTFYNVKRRDIFIAKSKEIVVWFSPHYGEYNNISVIEQPTYHGLMGLRSLVINKINADSIKNVVNLKELTKFTIGQGVSWSDTELYREYGFMVTEAKLSRLYNMLKHKRFDLLPLGYIEVNNDVLASLEMEEHLIISSTHMFYYPHMIFIHIAKKHKKQMARLKEGLDSIIKSGQFDVIFDKHFGNAIKELQSNAPLIFQFKNKNIPQKIIEQFKQTSVHKLLTKKKQINKRD